MNRKRIFIILGVIVILFLGIFTFAQGNNEEEGKKNNDGSEEVIDDPNENEEENNIDEENDELIVISTRDTKDPIIILNGDKEIYLELGEEYEELGAVATDNKDADKPATISGNVDITKAGIYTLTYSAKDKAGNVAKKVTRTINVRPVISVFNNSLSFLIGEYTEPKATLTYDKNIAPEEIQLFSSNVEPNKTGKYEVVFKKSYNGVEALDKKIAVEITDESAPECNIVANPDTQWSTAPLNLNVIVKDNDERGEFQYNFGDGYGNYLGWTAENNHGYWNAGVRTIIVKVKDASGNEAQCSKLIKIDKIVPIINSRVNDSIEAGVYTVDEMKAFINVTDQGGSGVNNNSITYNGENGEYNFNTLGYQTITYSAKDNAGNETTLDIIFNVIDTIAPVCSIQKNPNSEWTKSPVILTTTVEDATTVQYNYSNGYGQNVGWTFNETQDYWNAGVRTINVQVRDAAGHIGTCSTVIKIDNTAPIITSNVLGMIQAGDYTDAQMREFISATDQGGSGIDSNSITYNGSNNGYSFDQLGQTSVLYSVKDNAGNEKTKEILFNVEDSSGPSCSIQSSSDGWTKEDVVLTITAEDNYYGLHPEAYDFGNGWQILNVLTYTEEGKFQINAKVRDNRPDELGGPNTSNCDSIEVKIDRTAPVINTNYYDASHTKEVILNQNYTSAEMLMLIGVTETGSGIASITYNGNSTENYVFTTSGTNTVEYVVTDNVGLTDTKTVYFKVKKITEVTFDTFNNRSVVLSNGLKINVNYNKNWGGRINSVSLSINGDIPGPNNNIDFYRPEIKNGLKTVNDFSTYSLSGRNDSYNNGNLRNSSNEGIEYVTVYFEDEARNGYLLKIKIR